MSVFIRLPILSVASILLISCAANPNPSSTSVPPRASEASCKPDGLEQFVGQRASAESGAQMLRVSGAQHLRWVPPRTAVTMDFRADRLTIRYDDNMHITRVNCG